MPLPPEPQDLFISEYIEGSSYNKALEIFNGTGGPITIRSGSTHYYFLLLVSNPAGTKTWANDGSVSLFDDGAIINNEAVYVLSHSSAGPEISAESDQTSGATTFNGNDPVALVKDINNNGTYEDGIDVILDVIGDMSGTDWGGDVTLVRNYGSFGNGGVYNEIEFQVHPQDTFNLLGDCSLDVQFFGVLSDIRRISWNDFEKSLQQKLDHQDIVVIPLAMEYTSTVRGASSFLGYQPIGHFSCLYIDKKRKSLEYYDSKPRTPDEDAGLLRNALSRAVKAATDVSRLTQFEEKGNRLSPDNLLEKVQKIAPDFKISKNQIGHQDDSHSCGIFLLRFILERDHYPTLESYSEDLKRQIDLFNQCGFQYIDFYRQQLFNQIGFQRNLSE